MDPITHATTGALLAYAIPKHKRPPTRLFVVLGALMAASPDIDVIFATLPIDYILVHRGITHSLFAVPFLALLFTLLAFPLWYKKTSAVQAPSSVGELDRLDMAPAASMAVPWTCSKHFIFACACLLLHMWLDVVTTYGTMIFLPFSEYRVRLNGVFIVDILLTLPLLLAVWYGASHRPYAIVALIWMCVYPASCVALRYYHEERLHTEFQQELIEQSQGKVTNIMVFPDAFAPFNWRVVYQSEKPYEQRLATAYTWAQGKSRVGYEFPASTGTVYQRAFTAFGSWRSPLLAYPALEPFMAQSIAEQSRRGRAFLDFLVMPIMEKKNMVETGQNQWGVYDLRFSSLVKSVHELSAMHNGGQPTFLLEIQGSAQQSWEEVRLLLPGAGLDSGWQKPVAPRAATWWEKLVGIPY